MGVTFNPFTGTFDFTGSGGSSSGIGGTIAATQVAFGTAPDTIGGDAGLTYDSALNRITAGSYAIPTYTSDLTLSAVMTVMPIVNIFDDEPSIWIGDLDGAIHEGPEASIVFGGFWNSPTDWGGGMLWASHNGTTGSIKLSPIDANGQEFGGISVATLTTGFNINETVSGQGTITVNAGGTGYQVSAVLNKISYSPETIDMSQTPSRLLIEKLSPPTTDAVTAVIQAYDVDGAVYKTFGTGTNGNTPSWDWSAPSGGTLSGDFTTLKVGGTNVVTSAATPALDNLAAVAINAALVLGTSDAAALGSTTKQWSDLFLAEGGVIDWDNGDATLTQVGDVVTLAGADLKVTTSGNASTSVLTTDATQTLTNKRITKRVVTASDATSITPNTDSADVTYQANTQAAGTLTINDDGGAPTNGQSWLLKVKSTNVQTFSWNSRYVGGTVALPTATTGGTKIDNFAFIYDTVNNKWEYTGTTGGF